MSRLRNAALRLGLLTALVVPLASGNGYTSYIFSIYGYGQPPSPPGGPPAVFEGYVDFATYESGVLSAVDLSYFSLTDSYEPSTGPGSNAWTYGLSDLTSFSFNPTTYNLQLTTDFKDGNFLAYLGEVTVNGATADLYIDNAATLWATAGVAPSPEPSALALMSVPLIALFAAAIRKSKPAR